MIVKIVFEEKNTSVHPDIFNELCKKTSETLVSNVNTKMAALVFENHAWPITINQKEYRNALICSPYTTYVTYPLDELTKFKKTWIKCLVLCNTLIMSLLCRLTKFNQVAQVNNSLNNLIKHPRQFSDLLPQLTREIVLKFPKHAINFFRVNGELDKELLLSLKKESYLVFPDRPVYVFFPRHNFMSRSNTKRDMILLKKSPYTVISHEEITLNDTPRFAELYRQLFVEKHSRRNPIYTAYYFEKAIHNHWHHYVALKNSSGKIDAFISWFIAENTMHCGPLGYDHSVDQRVGLYRQLVAICLQHAHQHQLVFNMGGGSQRFKLNRGGTETWEYTAVYCKHLPFYRHLPWRILHFSCHKLLKKITDRAEL